VSADGRASFSTDAIEQRVKQELAAKANAKKEPKPRGEDAESCLAPSGSSEGMHES